MKAAIYLDVPEWQIGEDVSVYFPDTMVKHEKCELLKEQEPIKPTFDNWKAFCGACGQKILGDVFCRHCGRKVAWE